MNRLWFGLLFFIFQFVNVAFSAPDGSVYEVTIDPPKNGKGNNVVIDQNCSVSLGPDSKIYAECCFHIDRSFEKAKIIYEVKAPIPSLLKRSFLTLFKADDMKNGDDLCGIIQQYNIDSALGVSCPVTEGDQRICSTGEKSLYDLGPYVDLLPEAISVAGGKIVVQASIQYDDSGAKDIFEVTFTVAEAKKKGGLLTNIVNSLLSIL